MLSSGIDRCRPAPAAPTPPSGVLPPAMLDPPPFRALSSQASPRRIVPRLHMGIMMTALVATNGTPARGFDADRFSIVTIFGAETAAPAWQTMFGWPVSGGQAVPLDVRSAADRN